MLNLMGYSPAQTMNLISPSPTQWSLDGAFFFDAQKGFICGRMMTLYQTLNGGLSWTKISLPGNPSDPLYNVTFLDSNIGIVTGNSASGSQDIYRTTNAGLTWSRVSNFPLGGSWYDQDYVSPTTGFIGSNGAIVRTTDAGLTWDLRSGYPDCPSITGMDFLDANNGFATGGRPNFESGVFKTTNGGATWTLKLSGGASDVLYLTPTTLLAVTNVGAQRSVNGGETWTLINSSISTGIVDLEKVAGNVVVGVSSTGDIWRTIDGGFTWNRVWTGEGDLPGNWTVKFANAQFGVVVGVRGLAYSTQDSGQTWTRFNRGAAFDANALVALNNDTIVSAGHHGFIQTMSNNGPWNLFLIDPPTFGRDTAYSALSAIGADFVYAVGHEGSLARSLDGGTNWVNLTGAVNLAYYANDVKFTDRFNGWMTGWDLGTVPIEETYRTHDGGLTWQVATTGNFPGSAIEIIGSKIWIQSGGRAQWRSVDGGSTFSSFSVPPNSGSTPSVTDMSFANSLLGYVCGYDGYLAKTIDGGTSWTQVGSITANVNNLGVLAYSNELWVCGGRAGGGSAFAKRSLDKGLTWQTWSIVGQYSTPYRMARTFNKLYAAGYNGEIWRIDGLRKIPSTTGSR